MMRLMKDGSGFKEVSVVMVRPSCLEYAHTHYSSTFIFKAATSTFQKSFIR